LLNRGARLTDADEAGLQYLPTRPSGGKCLRDRMPGKDGYLDKSEPVKKLAVFDKAAWRIWRMPSSA